MDFLQWKLCLAASTPRNVRVRARVCFRREFITSRSFHFDILCVFGESVAIILLYGVRVTVSLDVVLYALKRWLFDIRNITK